MHRKYTPLVSDARRILSESRRPRARANNEAINEDVTPLHESAKEIHWYDISKLSNDKFNHLDTLAAGSEGGGQHLHHGEKHSKTHGTNDWHYGTSADQPNHAKVKSFLDKHAKKHSIGYHYK